MAWSNPFVRIWYVPTLDRGNFIARAMARSRGELIEGPEAKNEWGMKAESVAPNTPLCPRCP